MMSIISIMMMSSISIFRFSLACSHLSPWKVVSLSLHWLSLNQASNPHPHADHHHPEWRWYWWVATMMMMMCVSANCHLPSAKLSSARSRDQLEEGVATSVASHQDLPQIKSLKLFKSGTTSKALTNKEGVFCKNITTSLRFLLRWSCQQVQN